MSLQNSKNTGDLLKHSKANRKLLFVELFIALSLAVAFFFLVRNYFDYGNPMNGNVFMAGSEKLYRLNAPVMGGHWNERLSGLLLTGTLMDYSLSESGADDAHATLLRNVFGTYHACWLFLLFVCIIFSLRHSLFINLGIFAGLMYDFSPASGPYFFPWDISGMFFFTLAVLLFERRCVYLMMLVILAGAFFNESVLACMLFIFFADWKWGKRTAVFIGVLALYMLAKKLLLSGLQIEAPMLSLSAFFTLHGAFSPVTMASNLMQNLRTLFTPTLNSVIFANGGTLVGTLIFCWRRRFLPYMTVIIGFLFGLFVIAPPPPGISEVRAFMEVLPLCVVLLVELWFEYAGIIISTKDADVPVSTWPARETFPLLLPLTLAVIVISTGIAAFQYYIIYEDLQPANQAQSQLGKYVYQRGKPVSLEAVSLWFQNGFTDSELKLGIISQRDHRDADAISQYERVIAVDTNSIYALNNLATLLATSSDTRLRDGNRAVQLAERACELTQHNEPAMIYTLAAAYAEAGQFKDAVAAAGQAKALAIQQGNKAMADANEPLVELYRSGRPFHQQPPASAP